jgi:Holliday junction resolvase RusA-like endonuclease
MTFTLPLPETTNHAYATAQGRWYKTVKQKAWENEAGYLVMSKWDKKPLKGFIGMTIDLYLKRDRDIDGSIKPILDLFQRLGIYANDRNVTELLVEKFIDKKKPRVFVELEVI